MIDTHCHLTYRGLGERVEEVLAAAEDAGVDRMISVATDPGDAQAALALAERFEGVYGTAGIHPLHVAPDLDLAAGIETMRRLAAHPRLVALGEMGLDRFHRQVPLEAQRPVFEAQLELLAELEAAVAIIHNREATGDEIERITASGCAGARFVFHCFSGSLAELERILELGAMVSLTGIVTFQNAPEVAEAAKRVPLERLMIETDAPFLTPEPHRKVRPNEPKFVVEVARAIAAGRGMSVAELTAATDANAERFFGLPA